MSVARQVVIDDTDSHITYSGNWFQVPNDGSQHMINQGLDGLPYNGTSHGVTGVASLTFNFEGTSISLWGTLVDGAGHSPFFCFVDNKFMPVYLNASGIINNWKFCDLEGLESGSHVFQLNVGTTAPFWVDRLQLTPSSQAILDNNILLVNFTDAGLKFDLDWQVVPGTGRTTVKKGSQATFDFVGKSVTWIGFIPADMPHSPATGFFSIDGGPSTSFTLNDLPVDWTSTVRHQEFFTTPEVDHGSHSLLVTYNGSNFGAATPLTLEYLYLNTYAQTSKSSPPSTTPPQPKGQSGPNLVSALVGGIVGGLVLVIALINILCLWKRRRRRRQNTAHGLDSNDYVNGRTSRVSRGVTPFTFFQPFTFGTHDTPPFVKPDLPSPPNNGGPTIRVGDNTLSTHIIPHPPPIMSEGTAGVVAQPTLTQKNQVITPPNSGGPPVRYRDSGRRDPPAREAAHEEDMPPDYNTSTCG